MEFLVSSSFYVLRIVYLDELSPVAVFLALFVRSQVTNTLTIALVFLPKLWYQQKQVCHIWKKGTYYVHTSPLCASIVILYTEFCVPCYFLKKISPINILICVWLLKSVV